MARTVGHGTVSGRAPSPWALALSLGLWSVFTRGFAQEPPALEAGKAAAADRPAAVKEDHAWSRVDRYVPPDFEGFFAREDAAAVQALDSFLSHEDLRKSQPIEYRETVRRALRSTPRDRSRVLAQFGNTFVWNQANQDPDAIELLYHAAGSPELRHAALYYGATVVRQTTPNLIRMLVELGHRDQEIRQRIPWGIRTYAKPDQALADLERLITHEPPLAEATVLAAVELYRALADRNPPHPERYRDLGWWVVQCQHREDRAADPEGAARLRNRIRELAVVDDALHDWTVRVEGDLWQGWVLVRGLGRRDELLAQLTPSAGFTARALPFDDQFLARYRGTEFAHHLTVSPPALLPQYTPPAGDSRTAWNRTEGYQVPQFEQFFPDDPVAGMRLDELLTRESLADLTDQQVLEIFRKGLRRSRATPNQLFGWLSRSLGLPTDPRQTEIFFQAADPAGPAAIRQAAVYFGLTGSTLSPNVVALFHDILISENSATIEERETVSRIHWSLRFDTAARDELIHRLAMSLDRPELWHSPARLAALDAIYEQLAGKPHAARAAYADRVRFLVVLQVPEVSGRAAVSRVIQRRFGAIADLEFAVDGTAERNVWVIVPGYAGRDKLLAAAKASQGMRLVFVGAVAPETAAQFNTLIPQELRARFATEDPVRGQ